MKAIMISIKPRYVAKILNGAKTIEIRKTMPKCDLPIDVYIYCTKDKNGDNNGNVIGRCYPPKTSLKVIGGRGKVVAKFTLNKVVRYVNGCKLDGDYSDYEYVLKPSCLTEDELYDYADDLSFYAWHISNLEIFDEPKELSEFRHSHCDNLKNIKVFKNVFDEYVFQYFDNERCSKCKHYDSDCNDCLKDFQPLTKAPQSFMFIEVE